MMEVTENKGPIYEFGEFVVDTGERALLVNGERIRLADKVFDTLLLLIQHNGRLLTKDEMMSRLWEDSYVEESNLAKNISRLRKILHSNGNEFIETLPKQGYRFLADVKEIDGDTNLIIRREMHIKVTQRAEQPDESEASLVHIGPGRTERSWMPILTLTALSAAALIMVGYYIWFRATPQIVKGQVPVRLTQSPDAEDRATWTTDSQIRFFRFSPNTKTESLVMNSDGTNQRIAGDGLSDFRAGNWSPDGKEVLFTRKSEDPYTMFLANSDGSNEVRLPFKFGPIVWSPDSKQFAYNAYIPIDSKNSEIFIYSIESEKNINISNDPSLDSNPAFSPDGKRIIFNSDRDGNAEIYVMNVDGSAVRRLTNNTSKEAFQAFSPDGTQIIFDSNRENERVGIYLMNVDDDSPAIKISDTAYNEEIRPGCWSPDGTQIVFTSDRGGGKDNIYKMAIDPFSPRLLYADEISDIQSPNFSPDGKQIAFEAKLADGSGELRILDLEKNTARTISKAENWRNLVEPAWSPASDQIAFSCKIDGNIDVCTIRPDGTDLRNLTQNPGRDDDPTWSPDGKELIFTSDRDGRSEETHLFIMNSDGSDQRRVTQKGGYELTPDWSADGTRVIFAGDRMDGRSRGLDILSFEVNSSNDEKILASMRLHDVSPATSPDGARIAFVSQSDGNDEIYVMNADGSGLLRLTRNRASDTTPQFSRDNKRVIFSSNRNGKFAIFELTIDY